MKVRELIAYLGFKVDTAKVKEFDDAIAGTAKKMAVVGAAAVAFGGALVAAVKLTADAAGAAYEGARKLGITTEAYQELSHAAQLSGTTIEGVGVGVRKLSMLLDAAGRGSKESAATLAELGVSARDAEGNLRPADRVLEDIADRFKAMPPGMQKTALATKVFGRSGTELVNLLDEGGEGIRAMRQEAEAFGVVLGDDVAGKAEAFGDQLFKLKQMGMGLVFAVGTELIPVLSEFAEEVRGWYLANGKVLRQKVRDYVRGLAAAVRGAVDWLRSLWLRLEPVVKSLGGLENIIKKVAVALALYKTVDIVASVLQLGVAAVKAARAMMALNAAAAINPYVLLAIALIGAGFALEDLDKYASGADSAIGRFLRSTDRSSPVVNTLRESLRALLKEMGLLRQEDFGPKNAEPEWMVKIIIGLGRMARLVKRVQPGLERWKLLFETIGNKINENLIEPVAKFGGRIVEAVSQAGSALYTWLIVPILTFIKPLGYVVDLLTRAAGLVSSSGIGEIAARVGPGLLNAGALTATGSLTWNDALKRASPLYSLYEGFGATKGALRGAFSSAPMQNSVTMGPLTVNVPATVGTPEQVGAAVQTGVAAALSDSYRRVRSNLAGREE